MNISVVFFACAVRSGFVQISHLRLETSDCILHCSYVCKLTKKVDPSFQNRRGFYILLFMYIFTRYFPMNQNGK